MTAVATWVDPNNATQSASAYKAALDGDIAGVLKRLGAAFAAHEASTPALTIVVDAGAIFTPPTLTEVAQATVSGFTIPGGTDSRIDRVVIDQVTGVASRVAGTPGATPAAPAIPAGSLPCCRVLISHSNTVIANSMITDERAIAMLNETGTWTPAITFVTPGNLAVTYSSRTGYYRKNGPGVEISWTIDTTGGSFTHTTSSGAFQITGAPYIAVSLSDYNPVGPVQWQGITMASYTDMVAIILQGSAVIQMIASGSAQPGAFVGSGDMPTGGSVTNRGQLTYRTTA